MNNAISNKTVTKLLTILKKLFLPNLNPKNYLKLKKYYLTIIKDTVRSFL